MPPPCTDKLGEGGLSCTCASCTFAESSVTVSHARGYKISSHYRVRYRVERLEGVVAASWAATHPECRTRP